MAQKVVFTLDVELHWATVCQGYQLADVLRVVAGQFNTDEYRGALPVRMEDGVPILSENGYRIGTWRIDTQEG